MRNKNNRKKQWFQAAASVLLLAGISGLLFFSSGNAPESRADSRAAQPEKPRFSRESGCYDKGFDLALSAADGCTVYYTTDGSIPLSKEDAVQNATPTPAPTPTSKPVEFDLSADNTDYVYDVSVSEKQNGTQLAFAWRYRSMCFRVPQGETDWTKYKALVIDYSVDEAADGETVGLQACPIYFGAPDSYGVNGEFRCFEARTTSFVGAEHERWEISLAGKDVSEVGWIMLGTTTNESGMEPPDTITVHSIRLVKDAFGGEPDEKQDTQKYTAPIAITDRAGAPNVLSSKTNTNLMYNSAYTTQYAPKDSEVAKATVIRAIAVDAAGNRSDVVTKTYFVGNDLKNTYKNASVMSIVTDPDNLLSVDKGIYRKENYENSGREWERPAHVEYFDEDGSIPFATEMGIRLHGGWSRHYGQKSFNLYFREEYGGQKNLKGCQLIPGARDAAGNPITKYKSFMLRNGGNDTEYTKIQDVWIQSLLADRNFMTQAARPCVLFLNGEYWGPYNLTEKYSDNLIEEEFGVKKENVIVIKDNKLDEGEESDFAFYQELQGMADLDMKKEENYAKFCRMVDLQSYLDFYAVGTYIGNYDWPEKNVSLWRTRENDGTRYGDTKWRWMLFDTEYSMGLYGSSTGSFPLTWLLERDSLFYSLFRNRQFRQQFASTLCDLMNVNFRADAATASLEQYEKTYGPLMKDYFIRFGLDESNFKSNVSRMKGFVKNRRLSVLTDLKAHAEMGASTTLTIQGKTGDVAVNTTKAELVDGEWKGTYFRAVPVTLTAPEVSGYTFSGWKLANAEKISGDGNTVVIRLGKKPVVQAVYSKSDATVPSDKDTPAKPKRVKGVKIKASRKALSVSWTKVKGAKGYQVVAATNRKFTKNKRTVAVSGTSKKLKGLRPGKKYYVKVRAYNRSGKKKIYGAFSAVKVKKVG